MLASSNNAFRPFELRCLCCVLSCCVVLCCVGCLLCWWGFGVVVLDGVHTGGNGVCLRGILACPPSRSTHLVFVMHLPFFDSRWLTTMYQVIVSQGLSEWTDMRHPLSLLGYLSVSRDNVSTPGMAVFATYGSLVWLRYSSGKEGRRSERQEK